ncbi:MAG: translation initiation factor IF-2 [Flavobacteriales bacterium]|nr:translation initiation factor IF-2 [Flavobacteriales bacterium]
MAGAERLSKVAKELGVGVKTITDFLNDAGIECDGRPSTKISGEAHNLLLQNFSNDMEVREKSKELGLNREKRVTISIDDQVREKPLRDDDMEDEVIIKNISVKPIIDIPVSKTAPVEEAPKAPEPEEEKKPEGVNVVGKIDLSSLNLKTRPDKKAKPEKAPPAPKKVEAKKPEPPVKKEEKKEVEKPKPEVPEAPVKPERIETKFEKLSGPKLTGETIDLSKFAKKPKPVASSNEDKDREIPRKKKRRRIAPEKPNAGGPNKGPHKGRKGARAEAVEPTQEDIQKEIKETLARLSGKSGKSKGAKHRKAKRESFSQHQEELREQEEAEKNILQVTEFVTVNELASLMDVSANEVIGACMALGMFVSINQRLDAETLTLVAEEFGYYLEFTSSDVEDSTLVEADSEERISPRPPIVTVMGHVDHGKTSLLDYVRKANVIAGEAGGITQHIGAYKVTLDNEKTICFLDTPGHEAFTAMRSRGAQVTDIVIIVIAADDNVMPQTKEAINHAQAAGVPIIFAINKVDRPNANPEKIKEELAAMNYLVEDWGGKFQSQDISAKTGLNVDELLEKVLLEAELLDLKADAGKRATGTVIEAELDKGKGYVSTLLVQGGTLKIGDVLLAGANTGRVKAMFNERGQNVYEAGPATPVAVLGLSGAPSAGDKFNILDDEKEARNIANKRQQLQREQGVRTKRHITLDEIGRRIAIGDFQELNVIVKGDVDGSIEALSDSLLNLSTEKIQVNVIHKSVGGISESDILLASASNAIVIGFQVRPSVSARALAEKEEIDIRLYSIIYQAIEELKLAMVGMLKPTFEEKVVCNIEVRETFKITKVGTIAGCYVLDGTVTRNTKVRIIRDGIVVYSGGLGSLKRFKDDVKEVKKGFECGLNIENYNDIKVGDIIEGYEQVEVKSTL